jgi:ribose transport system substrate-binding protein
LNFSRSSRALVLGALTGLALGAFPTLHPRPQLPEITFIQRTSGTLPTEAMHRGANRAAREAGFRLYWNAPTREDDVDRQLLLMSNALHNDMKGLILGPTNGLALTTKINEFVARRIPIVVVQTETPIPAGPYVTSVAPDQSEVSRLAAERIFSAVGTGGEVAIVGLDRTAPETLQRSRNFVTYTSSHPAVKIVAQQRGTSLVPEAEQNAGEVLDRFPRLRALFAVSATATEGAILAIQRRGLGHMVVLVGCDDYLFLLSDLRAGRVDSVVVSDSDQMGYLAAEALLGAIHGRALPKPQYIGARLLTRDNLDVQSAR